MTITVTEAKAMQQSITQGKWHWVGHDEIEQVEEPFTSVAETVRIHKNDEQRNANARAIAAVPKMLATIIAMGEELEAMRK